MNKNRRMKHVVAASLAFGAAALTGFGQIAPAAVYAAEQTETVKTESTKSGEQADEGLFKEETVYVNADANGAVKLITVSDWLKNAGTTESLKDVSELDGIKNIKGEETFSESGDNLTPASVRICRCIKRLIRISRSPALSSVFQSGPQTAL